MLHNSPNMDKDLIEAEKARMTAFLNKGRSRTTTSRLAALRDTSSEEYKKYQLSSPKSFRKASTPLASALPGSPPVTPGSGKAAATAAAFFAGAAAPETPPAEQLRTTARKGALVGARDIVGKPSVLAGDPADRRSGPRTRFGDGDGSWWDRWLSFEPPRVSSYSNGFVAPLNGFKRERVVAVKGTWEVEASTQRRLVPHNQRDKVQAAFATTLLSKPPDLEDSDDSLDDDSLDGSTSSDSDHEYHSTAMPQSAAPHERSSLELLAHARSVVRSPVPTSRVGGYRSASLPPLSPMGPLMGANAQASPGATLPPRLAPLQTSSSFRMPDKREVKPSDVRRASYLPPSLLEELGVQGYVPPPSDSETESDDEMDEEEARDRALTSKFMGTRARWKLFHKYRNVDRAYPNEHVRGPAHNTMRSRLTNISFCGHVLRSDTPTTMRTCSWALERRAASQRPCKSWTP